MHRARKLFYVTSWKPMKLKSGLELSKVDVFLRVMEPVYCKENIMAEIDAIIMAAGLSRRMGEQKLVLPFGTTTLLGYFLKHFPYELFREVFLVYSDERVAEIGREHSVKLVLNSTPEQGQSGSIRCGVEQSQARDGMLFTVADQPFLDRQVIAVLVDDFSHTPTKIVRPQYAGRPQNPVIFPRFCQKDLCNLVGDQGGRAVIAQHPQSLQLIEFTDGRCFKDVDRREDYTLLLGQVS